MLHTLLCLLPAVALVLPLLARRYPGAARLAAVRRARAAAPATRGEALPASPGRRLVWAVRGGLLIGRSLAVRPPPAVPTAAS